MSRLLLNCDIGESFGAWTMGLDAEVMPFIDCANVACGFHAGDPDTMRATVERAKARGVAIGALPLPSCAMNVRWMAWGVPAQSTISANITGQRLPPSRSR